MKEKFKLLNIQTNLYLKEDAPEICEILSQRIMINIKDKYIVKTPDEMSYEGQNLTGVKLVVNANLNVLTEYTSNEGNQEVYTTQNSIPITTHIVIPKQQANMQFDINAIVEHSKQYKIDEKTSFINVVVLFIANEY